MNPLEVLRSRLIKLAEQRAALSKEMRATLEGASAAGRELTDDEQKAYDEKRAALVKADDDIDATQKRVVEMEEDERRADTAAQILAKAGQTGQRRSGGAVIGREPMTYDKRNGRSYFLDLARAQFQHDQDAQQRLYAHAKELSVELPKREAKRSQRAEQQLDRVSGLKDEQRESVFERGAPYEQRVNPNRTDGQGGRVAVLCG